MENSVLSDPRIRPRSLTLLLVDEDQVENLIKLVGTFRSEYDGALLLCCNLSQALAEEVQQRIREASELSLRNVERSISLSPGKLYWLNTDLNYGINATEQIYRLNPNAASAPNLLNHLKRNFPQRSRVLLLGETFLKRLAKSSYLTDIKLSLLTTAEIAQQNPLLSEKLASHFSIEVYDDPSSLAVAANTPIPRMNRRIERRGSADSEAFRQIMNLLEVHKNVDFSLYKEASLLDRIDQRMHRQGLLDLADYGQRLRVDSVELDALYAHLFVGMTSFFRDTESFLELYHYLEEYLSHKPIKSLRIWSAGCSTGAEAYSVALICDRLRRSSEPDLTAEVIGTDLNPKAIELATEGKFTLAQLAKIPSEFLPEKLIEATQPVDLCEEVNTAVRFQQHNLLGYEPLGQFDLILCRNVFIYLSTQTQSQVLVNFHEALNTGGILMLGRSESVGERGLYFVAKSERAKIYRALQLSPSS